MSLSDGLEAAAAARRARRGYPTGLSDWTAKRDSENRPAEVALNLKQVPENEEQWRREINRVTGLDIPDERSVELTDVRYWGDPQEPYVYCKFAIKDRVGESTLDLAEIIQVVQEAEPVVPPDPTDNGYSLVVALADMQVGKTGSRGGTEELISRIWEKLEALEDHILDVQPDTVYLFDVGDCIEGFENTASQMHTNDLSFPEQLRVARRILTECVVRIAQHAPQVVVSAVPSNHGRWRRGKDALGHPKDDFGLENLTAVADACDLAPEKYGHVSFVVPETWQESMAFDLHGTIVGVAHGHQSNRPDGIPLWWARQTHGGQPVADADILLTGHFHHLRVQATGHNPVAKRSKWWFQAPTMDNGSDWYRLKGGDDSDPGLLCFTVSADGWRDLVIL